MNIILKNTIALGVISLFTSMNSIADDDLISVCGKSDFSVKNQISVQASQRVSLLQSGMVRIQTEGDLPTEELLISEMSGIGITKDCAEYFISQGDKSEMNGRVYFKFNRSSLTPASVTVLNAMLEKIRNTDNKILLEGHTDSIGSDAYNFTLGMKRALSVESFIKDNQVNDTIIESVSFGETQPVASNATSEGRQLNRRVEIKGL